MGPDTHFHDAIPGTGDLYVLFIQFRLLGMGKLMFRSAELTHGRPHLLSSYFRPGPRPGGIAPGLYMRENLLPADP